MPFKHVNIDAKKPMVFNVPMICQYTKLPGTFLAQMKTGVVRDKDIVHAPERTVYIPVHQGVYAFKPR